MIKNKEAEFFEVLSLFLISVILVPVEVLHLGHGEAFFG